MALRRGGSAGSRCGSPFFPRVLKHFVGLGFVIGQGGFWLKQGRVVLKLLPNVMDRRSAQIQLPGHLGGAFSLNGPAQQQHDLCRGEVAPLEDRPTVEGVGLGAVLAAPDLESAGFCPAEAVGLPPAGLAARTLQALGMKVLSEPDAAPIVIDKVDERKVHIDSGLPI